MRNNKGNTMKIIGLLFGFLLLVPWYALAEESDSDFSQYIVVMNGSDKQIEKNLNKLGKSEYFIGSEVSRSSKYFHLIYFDGQLFIQDRPALHDAEASEIHEAICRELKLSLPTIVACDPNKIIRISADTIPNDPRWSELWGLERISAPAVWSEGGDSAAQDTIVAVIDTGILYDHPDLEQNMWRNPGEIPGNGKDDDGNGYIDDIFGINAIGGTGNPRDNNGHGTHCAGTIGGVGNNNQGVAGVNWRVKLMGGKFLDSTGAGTSFDSIEAINYAVAHGAKVISASFGGTTPLDTQKIAIKAAGDAGVLFIAAAGNSALDNDVLAQYPSNYGLDNIVAVAATDQNDLLANFSNYGSATVDIAAPGVDIVSTVLGNSYEALSGTSMATPHVAGAAALLIALFPSESHLQIKQRLLNGSSLPALQDRVSTGARLNLLKAKETVPGVVEPGPLPKIKKFVGKNTKNKWKKKLHQKRNIKILIEGTPGTFFELKFVFSGKSFGGDLSPCAFNGGVIPQSGKVKIITKLPGKGVLKGTKKVKIRLISGSESTTQTRDVVKKNGDKTKPEDQVTVLKVLEDLPTGCTKLRTEASVE